jgi:hypothetical protein
MVRYKRVKGGEKNSKTGQRWTKEELEIVFSLYKKIKGMGIHENNPQIHHVAGKLNRTVRSVEAQLLMFRNLEKHGYYGYGNMSSICKEIWVEYKATITKSNNND